MIIKVNGSDSIKFEEGVSFCGVDETDTPAAGLGISSPPDSPGGVIPMNEVFRLRRFLDRWLKENSHKKGSYYEIFEK